MRLPNFLRGFVCNTKSVNSPHHLEDRDGALKMFRPFACIGFGCTQPHTDQAFFMQQVEFLISGLMLVGILMGIFYFDSDDVINIGLRYLIFIAVASSIGGFYKIGSYLSGFLVGFSYYLGPIVLTLLIVYFVKKYLLNRP